MRTCSKPWNWASEVGIRHCLMKRNFILERTRYHTHGGFLTWGYPQLSSIYRSYFPYKPSIAIPKPLKRLFIDCMFPKNPRLPFIHYGKSCMFMVFSLVNHQFWGTTMAMETLHILSICRLDELLQKLHSSPKRDLRNGDWKSFRPREPDTQWKIYNIYIYNYVYIYTFKHT